MGHSEIRQRLQKIALISGNNTVRQIDTLSQSGQSVCLEGCSSYNIYLTHLFILPSLIQPRQFRLKRLSTASKSLPIPPFINLVLTCIHCAPFTSSSYP